MYNNKLIVVVKINNEILRENGEYIYVPSGSEYSLNFKNLESRRALVKVQIDGVNVLSNHSLIINPNEEVNLERFITNNDLDKGNKFKFIKKTKEISKYRGDKIDDGIIRIEFQFEKEKVEPIYIPSPIVWYTHEFQPYHIDCWSWDKNTIKNNEPKFKNEFYCSTSINNCNTRSICENNFSNDLNDDGITVKGSISNQGFKFSNIDELESNVHTIIFKLKCSNKDNNEIKKPLTVNTRLICETCGKSSKSTINFCPNCGTSLV